jgi:hypothetical protein
LGRNPPLAPLFSFGEFRAGLFFLPKFDFAYEHLHFNYQANFLQQNR